MAEAVRGVERALQGEEQGTPITFASADLLRQVLTRGRWELRQIITGVGSLSIRETARRLGRDVRAVQGDVQTLLTAGVVDRTEAGKILFPYDGVHVDFRLLAA